MTNREKTGDAPETADAPRSAARDLVSRLSRSHGFGLVLTGVGGGIGGYGAALLLGVPAGFSQPLATVLAGEGALSAGVLAYVNGERSRALSDAQHKADTARERERHAADTQRERERHAEDSRREQESKLRDRYATIAGQIAHDSPAIRQAGVYALTALADDWHAFGEDEERQVCINLLQWYLRVPLPQEETPEGKTASEREIRQTIVKILTERRRRPSDDPKSWAATTVDLQQASLPGLSLGHVDFTGISLGGADLSNGGISSANLAGVYIAGANLSTTIMAETDFTGANLSFAKIRQAMLIKTKLPGAGLAHADLSRVIANEVDLTNADLRSADLTKAKIYRTEFVAAALISADLTGAQLTYCNFTAANLNRAKLIGTDLTGADLTGAVLYRADLTDAVLTDVKFNEYTQWPEGFTPSDSET